VEDTAQEKIAMTTAFTRCPPGRQGQLIFQTVLGLAVVLLLAAAGHTAQPGAGDTNSQGGRPVGGSGPSPGPDEDIKKARDVYRHQLQALVAVDENELRNGPLPSSKSGLTSERKADVLRAALALLRRDLALMLGRPEEAVEQCRIVVKIWQRQLATVLTLRG